MNMMPSTTYASLSLSL
uniref:Uncharacterized protein n=1 Tax=Rhizophora mucronata TaxID=61149 RepID=A0A2P2IP98_RHIMU